MEEVQISAKFSYEMGQRIAERRKQLGLTQQQLAERAGVSHQFFAAVETGKKNIRAENILRLSLAMNVSTDYILAGRRNDFDKHSIISLMDDLDEVELRYAEEIIKNLVAVCKHNKE